MYSRLLEPPDHKSFFLFGPRGTGKTWWVQKTFPKALYLDLLETELYTQLLARPERLNELIPPNFDEWIIIDEVQKIPALLQEVHRLIEHRGLRFVLTGSSARSLRRKGINLLAGRALTCHMHPLTAIELGKAFDLQKALTFGTLPSIPSEVDPRAYLEAYVKTYLREEVLQEGLTRNLGTFSRFLEVASFSQSSALNITEVARESAIPRKTVEGYFDLLEDLLLSFRLPVFTKRAKRKLAAHPKFYFFDAGVYRTLRPKGPLDSAEEINGAALETLVIQQLRAINDAYQLGYELFYWRTATGLEVDFIAYGPNGLHAIEVKRSRNIGPKDLKGLKAFGKDYPEAKLTLFYGGSREEFRDNVQILPIAEALFNIPLFLREGQSGQVQTPRS